MGSLMQLGCCGEWGLVWREVNEVGSSILWKVDEGEVSWSGRLMWR